MDKMGSIIVELLYPSRSIYWAGHHGDYDFESLTWYLIIIGCSWNDVGFSLNSGRVFMVSFALFTFHVSQIADAMPFFQANRQILTRKRKTSTPITRKTLYTVHKWSLYKKLIYPY